MEEEIKKEEKYVSFDDFKKMDMRVGTIASVEPVPETEKLLKCMINFGDKDSEGLPIFRHIVSGIRESYPEYEKLVGKQALYVVNLEPRMIRGVESHGMLMAVDGIDGKAVFLIPESEVNPGTAVH